MARPERSCSVSARPRGDTEASVIAVDACRRNGWQLGTLLVSSKWNAPRKITRMDDFEVELGAPDRGFPFARRLAVKKFPADVKEKSGE